MKKTEKTKEQLLTEIEELKSKISESESKSRLWLENSPICTKIIDLDFNLQYMSSSGAKELKIKDITEFYGKPYPLHFFPDSFKIPMKNNLKKAKETGEIITQEASVVDIEGNELWFHSTIVPVYKDQGQLDYIMVVSLETTVRVQAEKALQKSNSQLTSILESPDNVIMFALDANYNYLSFNQAHVKEMKLIYDTDIEIGKHIIDFIPNEEDRAKVVINYKRVLKGERFIEIQQYGIGEDRFWYELIFNPIFDDSNQATEFTVFVTNISERKLIEEELHESKEQLDLALNGADAGLWSWNIKTGENLLDERWCGILGFRKEEIKQEVSSWENLIHPDDKEGIIEVVKKHFEDANNEYKHEYRMKCKNGDWKWILALGKIVERDAEGQPARMTGIIIDIDKQKKAEEELKEHRDHLEKTVKERTKELEEKNKKLDDAMKVFVGRELTIKSLQERIIALEGE